MIMDNLASHKVAGALAAIAGAGTERRFPPPYSPDMDPIEPLFGKVKPALRKMEKRTVDGLWNAVGVAIQDVSETERRDDFRNTAMVTPKRDPL